MKARLLGLLMTIAVAFTAAAAPDDNKALADSKEWLSLVDGGQYAESWTQACSLFREKIEQQRWAAQVKSARDQFGDLISRQVLKLTLAKSLPGAPDGDYAVVTFQADFAKKHQAVETVTMMLESDRWQAAGYFIK
jgi:hypothetical protein